MIKFDKKHFDTVCIDGVEYPLDGTHEKLKIKNEVFELNEGAGTLITSKNGETATICTKHAAGVSYINEKMWVK